jgi:hypothetical protein
MLLCEEDVVTSGQEMTGAGMVDVSDEVARFIRSFLKGDGAWGTCGAPSWPKIVVLMHLGVCPRGHPTRAQTPIERTYTLSLPSLREERAAAGPNTGTASSGRCSLLRRRASPGHVARGDFKHPDYGGPVQLVNRERLALACSRRLLAQGRLGRLEVRACSHLKIRAQDVSVLAVRGHDLDEIRLVLWTSRVQGGSVGQTICVLRPVNNRRGGGQR